MNRKAVEVAIDLKVWVFCLLKSRERVLRNKNIGAQISGLGFNTHTDAHLFRAAQEGSGSRLNTEWKSWKKSESRRRWSAPEKPTCSSARFFAKHWPEFQGNHRIVQHRRFNRSAVALNWFRLLCFGQRSLCQPEKLDTVTDLSKKSEYEGLSELEGSVRKGSINKKHWTRRN